MVFLAFIHIEKNWPLTLSSIEHDNARVIFLTYERLPMKSERTFSLINPFPYKPWFYVSAEEVF